MENEIKVGEYCRTDKGQIFKVDENKINIKLCKFLDVEYGDIVKHSPNLIDLIQCGDYVNGEYVLHIDNNVKEYGDKTIITELNKRYFGSQIIQVVTKEMMKSMSYKVERED